MNEIFFLLSKDKTVAELYKGWCEIQAEIIKSYRLDFDSLPPLVEQKEFHSIRNQIIKAAVDLQPPTEQTRMQNQNVSVASSVISLLNSLSKMAMKITKTSIKKCFRVDSKLMAQIAEKKQALGQRSSRDEEQYGGPTLSM